MVVITVVSYFSSNNLDLMPYLSVALQSVPNGEHVHHAIYQPHVLTLDKCKRLPVLKLTSDDHLERVQLRPRAVDLGQRVTDKCYSVHFYFTELK